MKLWHDDVRPPPEGWAWARTNMEAKQHLRTGEVEEISMDHDLGLDHINIPEEVTTEELHQFLSLRGDGPHNGLELARWMIANNLVPKKITIHSWNALGAHAMRAAFEDAGITCSFIPFVPTGGWMEYRTKTGRVLTDADIEELSKEAEEGYVNRLLAGRKVITPLQVVVDLLRDSLISIEGDEKEMALTQIRQAIELIKVSDGQ